MFFVVYLCSACVIGFVLTLPTYRNEHAQLAAVPHGEIDVTSDTIDLDYNLLTEVGDLEFSNYTSLQNAYLSRNRISTVSDSAFYNTRLKNLYLTGNRLQTFPNVSLISGTISKIYIQENRISFIPNGSFEGCVKLKLLFIAHNLIAELDVLQWSASALPMLEQIDSAHNVLTSLPRFGMLDRIKKIQLNGNRLSDYISNHSDIFNGSSATTLLNINKNEVTTFPNISALRLTLQIFTAIRNRITYIPKDTFDGFVSLVELQLSENPLRSIPELSTAAANLHRLDLNWIGLTYFDLEVAKTLTSISTLFLKGIQLTSMMNFTVLNETLSYLVLGASDVELVEGAFLPTMQALREVNFEDGRVHCIQQVYFVYFSDFQ